MYVDVTVISTAANVRHGRVSTPQRKVRSRADSSGNTDIRIGQHQIVHKSDREKQSRTWALFSVYNE